MLRDYQQRTIDQLYAWFEAGEPGNPCLVLPTGSGKSHIVAVFMVGDQPDKPRPKPNVRENRRRSEAKRNTTFRMNSVFNMAMTRDKIRELRRAL